METYKLDRIYTWLSSAIRLNQQAEKKYFYDIKLKLFFNLGCSNGNYFPWTNQMPLTKPHHEIIKEEIELLKNEFSRFIEIDRSDSKFDVMPINPARNLAEYEYQETQWKALFAEVQSFLIKNSIPIDETCLIE